MPYTEKQRRFMYAEAARAEKGQRTRTGMSLGELMEHAQGALKKPKAKGSEK